MKERQAEPPEALKRLQEGLGQAIRLPVSFETGKFAFASENYAGSIASAVLPRGKQSGRDRLSIYNEQYWFRLFTILQEDYPLLAATLGMWRFNQLACAYLDRFPSRSPFLDKLADKFEAFLGGDAPYASTLTLQIAALETALAKTFHAPASEAFRPDRFAEQVPAMSGDSVLVFQSGFSLFEEDWNLMESRVLLLKKNAEDPVTLHKPVLESRKGYWAIFRKEGRLDWKEIDRTQYRLLSELARGCPLGEACEKLVADLDANLDEEALGRLPADLPRWFAEWTAAAWFTAA